MKSLACMRVLVICFFGVALHSSCGGRAPQSLSEQALAVITPSLPNGITGTLYAQTVHATGGIGPFSWIISTGALPHNLSLSSSTTNAVTISGTPDTGALGVTFTLKVIDSSGQSAAQDYTVSVLLSTDNLILTPPNLDFGVQLVGSTGSAQTETLMNNGGSPLGLSAIAVTGALPLDFSQQSSTCGFSLMAGAQCQVDLKFTPSQLGPRTAVLSISDDIFDSPQLVSVSGIGVTSGPNATLSATSMVFGNQTLYTTSPAQSITLNNYGSCTLDVTAVSASTRFRETDDCTGNLASGSSCTINVTFTPNTTGVIAGTLSLLDNAPGSPQDVLLSGTGTTANQCVSKGGQCYQGHNCCIGLVCVDEGTRHFCE